MRPTAGLLWLGLGAVLAAAAPEARETTYTTSCTPGDAVLAFGNASQWNVSDTQLGQLPLAWSGEGSGVLRASTNVSGASVSFAYFGAGFRLRGAGSGSLLVKSGGEEGTFNTSGTDPNAVLFASNGTDTPGWRNVTVALANGSMELSAVEVEHAVSISANGGSEAPTLSVPATWLANSSLNDAAGFYAFEGNWEQKNVSSREEEASTAQLSGAGSVAFSVPPNTTFVRLNGHTLGEDCAPYEVAMTADNNPTSLPEKQSFMPLCLGPGHSVLYEAALSPSETYRLTLTSTANDSQVLGFTSAQFMSSTLDMPHVAGFGSPISTQTHNGSTADAGSQQESSEGGGSNHAGAIAGGVIGGLAGLALLAGLLWFCCRRKKARRHSLVDTEEASGDGHEKRSMYAEGSVSPTPLPADAYDDGGGGFWSKLSRKAPAQTSSFSKRSGRLSSVPPQLSPIKTALSPPGSAAPSGGVIGPSEALKDGNGSVASRKSKFSNTSWSLLSLGRSKEGLAVPMAEKEQRRSKMTYTSQATHLSWSSWDILDAGRGPHSATRSKFSNSSWSFIQPPSGPNAAAAEDTPAASPRVPGTPSTPDSPVPPPPPLSPLPAFNPPAFDAYANRSDSEISTLPKESFDASRSFEASRSTFARTSMDSTHTPALAMLRTGMDSSRSIPARSDAGSSFSNLTSFNLSHTSFKMNPLLNLSNVNTAPRSALARAASQNRAPTSPTRPNGPSGPRAPSNLMRSMSQRVALGTFGRSKHNLPDVRLSEDNGNTLERLEKEVRRASQQ